MKSDILFGVLLRLLPSLILLVLAFVAAADRKTREQWTNLLYQSGSLHPDKLEDPDVQKSVRIPFFIVALVFLILPIGYYLHANTTVEISTSAFGNSHKAAPGETAPAPNTATNAASTPGTANAANTAGTSSAPSVAATPASPAPVAGATPATTSPGAAPTPSFNPYASHKHPQ